MNHSWKMEVLYLSLPDWGETNNLADEIIKTHLSHHFRGDRGFTHNRLAPTLNPVDGSWFLVSAVVPANRHHLKFWEVLLQYAESLLCALHGNRTTGGSHMRVTFLLQTDGVSYLLMNVLSHPGWREVLFKLKACNIVFVHAVQNVWKLFAVKKIFYESVYMVYNIYINYR